MTTIIAVLAFAFAFLVFVFLGLGAITVNTLKWTDFAFAAEALGLLMLVLGPGLTYVRDRTTTV